MISASRNEALRDCALPRQQTDRTNRHESTRLSKNRHNFACFRLELIAPNLKVCEPLEPLNEQKKKEIIRMAMSIMGSRRSKRKTEAARANIRKRWEKERQKKKLKKTLADTNTSN